MTVPGHPLLPGCRRDYWMDAASMAAGQACMGEAVEQLEAALGTALGEVRGDAHSPAYWQRTIGPFVWQLVCFVFDRICDELEPAPLRLEPAQIPYSARDFVNQVIDRKALCALLDAALALPLPARREQLVEACAGLRVGPDAVAPVPPPLKARLRRVFTPWEGVGEVTHYGAPFTTPQALALAAGSGGRIRRAKFPERAAVLRYDGALRLRLLEAIERRAPTLGLVAEAALVLAVFLLPTAFLEQHGELVAALGDDLEQPVKVVATAQGFVRSPAFAVFAATVAERGARVVGLQHGGFYGQMEETWGEIAEHQHSDVFCTWGYRYREHDYPMPPPRLAKLRDRGGDLRHPQALLWAMSAWLYMIHVNASVPHYRRYEEMNRRQMQDVRAAMAQRAFELRVRPYPRTRQDPMLQAWSSEVPGTRVDPGGCDLLTHARRCALLVFNFPGATGFLECIRTDTPAIIYCPEDLVPVRPEARAVYEQLAEAGLYLRRPEELAAVVAERLDRGPGWWATPSRVAAREAFRRQFAWGEAPVVSAWRRFFLEQAALAARAGR